MVHKNLIAFLLGILSVSVVLGFPCSDDADCMTGLSCTVNNGRFGVNSGICVDCEGIEDGSARKDRCGVCNGNDECVGCDNIPNSGSVVDQCGICGGDDSACVGCDGIPNSGVEVDECGVCGGDGSGCAGCDGVPNSGAVLDLCGKCNGNNDCCRRSEYDNGICSEHGACDPNIPGDENTRRCVCDIGWTGPLCDIEQYYCTDAAGEYSMVDCGEHGSCSEQLRGGCTCDEGYFGPKCDMKMCGAHAVWQPSLRKCVCREGFKGETCNQCSEPGDLHNVKEIINRMSRNVNTNGPNKPSILISAKDEEKTNGKHAEREMSFVCVSPSIYNQRYYNSIEIVDSNAPKGKATENANVEGKLVNYELLSFPKETLHLLLKGRDPFSQGLPKDELPVLPNSTRNGIYYDCGCFAWTVESVRGIKPSKEDEPFIQSRSANMHISYNDHDHALAERGAFMHHHIVSREFGSLMTRASNASIANNTIANNLLNDCLEALSVEATSESTPEQIGQLICHGIDNMQFTKDFCVGFYLASISFFMFAFMFGVIIFVFYNFLFGFGTGFSLSGSAFDE